MIPELNTMVEQIPEALSIFVNQIVYDKKNKGEIVYTYSLGEAFFDVPRFEVSDDKFKRGCHYSSSMGQPKLRDTIAKMYKDYYDVDIDSKSEIIVSAGSKPIIFMILKAVLKQDEEVLVREPAWLSYKEQIRLAGGHYIPIPYYEDVYKWDDYITDKTKVIIINNPNNPSGYLYSKEELEYLLKLAEEHNLFILSDEAYSDFLLPDDKFISFANVDKTKEHCLVVNSLSKNMGMSGWRVGYAISNDYVIKQLLKLNQHLITCAGTVLQDYMADHFFEILEYTVPQARNMAVKRLEVSKIMDEIGIEKLYGVGTFYFLLDIDKFVGTTDELVYDLLFNHNIATVPGEAYGESTARFIRFGIGLENLENIRKSLLVIKSFLELNEYDATNVHMQMDKYGIPHGDKVNYLRM